jgi:hypothetical protein
MCTDILYPVPATGLIAMSRLPLPAPTPRLSARRFVVERAVAHILDPQNAGTVGAAGGGGLLRHFKASAEREAVKVLLAAAAKPSQASLSKAAGEQQGGRARARGRGQGRAAGASQGKKTKKQGKAGGRFPKV